MTHAEFRPGQTECPGHLTMIYQLDRRTGVFSVYKCQQCAWTNAPQVRRRRPLQTDTAPISQRTHGVIQMKIRIGASLKSGLPNYGSVGSSAEIELTLDDEISVEAAISAMRVWQKAADQAVEDEQRRKAARYPQPATAVAPAPQPEPARPEPPGRRYGPDDIPPADSYADRPPARQNGSGPPRNGSGGQPRNGRQLIGWANSHGRYESLMSLAKELNRGRIVDWEPDLVEWAYTELDGAETRQRNGGGWGSGSGSRN